MHIVFKVVPKAVFHLIQFNFVLYIENLELIGKKLLLLSISRISTCHDCKSMSAKVFWNKEAFDQRNPHL